MDIYDKIVEASEFIKRKIDVVPEAGVVLGSGLGDFADEVDKSVVIPYDDIPHFKKVKVKGHAGNLVAGMVSGKAVVVLQGRYHFYEGHDIRDIVFPVRVLCSLGIKDLIITNAAGGINGAFTPGDLMVITDHINLMGENPLTGDNDERLGPRFPDMSSIYDNTQSEKIISTARSLSISVKSGVYAGLMGPSYETPAEIRMLKAIGADSVGMSTVPEAIAAKHMGMNVMGVSCITNYAAGITDQPLDHKEVTETADRVKEDFINLLTRVVGIL
ncbi:MAG: purine-nucleoside phosphorylase [Acidobacteriota bacterium]